MEQKFTVGLLVSNHFGVLNRVSGLYGKRGFNIDSLSVGTTENPEYSRMTIVSYGDEDVQNQVVKQLRKLYDVKKIILYQTDEEVSIEQLLIKLSANNSDNAKISKFINLYGGKVLDFGGNFITAEITADTDTLNQFIDKCREYGILELCRSGAVSLARGTKNMLSVTNSK